MLTLSRKYFRENVTSVIWQQEFKRDTAGKPTVKSKCYSLAVASNTRATRLLCCPSPRWGAEENGKKQAKTGGSG